MAVWFMFLYMADRATYDIKGLLYDLVLAQFRRSHRFVVVCCFLFNDKRDMVSNLAYGSESNIVIRAQLLRLSI